MSSGKMNFHGKVVRGEGIAGVDYDLPTANLRFMKEPDIDTGVYAAKVEYNGDEYRSIVCYGVGDPVKFEVHMFGFDADIFGEELSVLLLEKVSELIPWQSKERMRQKIFHDIELVHKSLDKQEKKA